MNQTILSDQAIADIKSIGLYIAQQSGHGHIGDEIGARIVDACERLGNRAPTTRMGQRMEHVGSGVRAVNCERWVILFRYVPAGVEVLRIVDGRRDYQNWEL